MQPTNTILSLDDVKKEILEFCLEPQVRIDILEHIQVDITPDNYARYIKQLQDQRFITPESVKDSAGFRTFRHRATNQKFVITQKGLNYLKAIAL